MNNKIKLFVALLFTSTVYASTAETLPVCVVVERTDGTMTKYQLADKPRICYIDDVVQLTTNYIQVVIAAADIKKVYLDDLQETSIERSNLLTCFSITADGIILSGLIPGSTVTIATIDGRIIQSNQAQADGTLWLPFAAKQKSIIVIKTNNQSFKLIIK